MKRIIITGASGNLGKAVCEKFTSRGWHVIGICKNTNKDHVIDGPEYHEADLSNETETNNLIDVIKQNHEQIDALVCLAGGFGMTDLPTTSMDDIQSMIDLNFATSYHITRTCHGWMKDTGGGNIIFTGAKPALDGGASGVLGYALSKSLLFQFSEILNEQANDSKVRSSIIVPGIIDTPVNRQAMPDANFDDWVRPDQIAGHIYHLCSDAGAILRNTVLRLYNNI